MSAEPAPAAKQWTALATLIAALMGYSLCVIMARTVYDHGGNALVALISRMGLFAVGMLVFFRVKGESPMLPPSARYASLGLGLIVTIQSYAYYSSFEFIPVSLAALVFYTYPTLVAVTVRLISRTPLTPLMLGALITAFLGIALVLEVSLDTLNPYGIARAFVASIGMATTAIVSSRILRRADARRMAFHSAAAAGTIYVLAAIFTGGAVFPVDVIGWAALLALPLFYVVAVIGWYSTIAVLGAMRVAFISNGEPIFTVIMATTLLGEVLSLQQMIGAALVIGAIFAVQIFGRSRGS